MKKPNIILIGFMATGKTTVGEILSKKLNKRFIETDKIIEQKAGKEIPKIFSEDGEIKFRELEMAVCKELSECRNVIISTGGGVVLNKLNIDYLKQNGYIVLIESTAEDIYKRILIDGKEKRPLLNKPDPFDEIKKLLSYRKPFYNAAAEFRVTTYNKVPEQIADEIIELIENEKKQSPYFDDDNLGKLFEQFSNLLFDKNINKNIVESLGEKSNNEIMKFTEIIEHCTSFKGINPIHLLENIFQKFGNQLSIKQLNMIVPGILLSSFRNFQIKNNIQEIFYIPDMKEGNNKIIIKISSITNEKIVIGMMRASLIPIDSDVYLGICEEVLGIGICISIILGITPKNKEFLQISNKAMLFALNDLIEKKVIVNGSKKDRIESVIISFIKFLETKFFLKIFE